MPAHDARRGTGQGAARPGPEDGDPRDRADLVARWLFLTRQVMPAMAVEEGWPIRLDHCFMRVCLDEAMGRVWSDVVARPAVRTMAVEQLAAAVRVAESIVADPDRLPSLNLSSLARRRTARAKARQDC